MKLLNKKQKLKKENNREFWMKKKTQKIKHRNWMISLSILRKNQFKQTNKTQINFKNYNKLT